MSEPSDSIATGFVGCGCLSAVVLVVVGLFSGAGFVGSILMALFVLFMAGYAASLLS